MFISYLGIIIAIVGAVFCNYPIMLLGFGFIGFDIAYELQNLNNQSNWIGQNLVILINNLKHESDKPKP